MDMELWELCSLQVMLCLGYFFDFEVQVVSCMYVRRCFGSLRGVGHPYRYINPYDFITTLSVASVRALDLMNQL